MALPLQTDGSEPPVGGRSTELCCGTYFPLSEVVCGAVYWDLQHVMESLIVPPDLRLGGLLG